MKPAPTKPGRLGPVGGLLHPVPILGILLLLLNDHVLKEAFPGLVTGKLSDFAGLAFFPLLLQAGWEYVASKLGRYTGPDRRLLIGCAAATGLYFSGVQLLEPVTDSYRWALGALQWPFLSLGGLLAGRPPAGVHPVQVWPDPWDLVALPALGLAVWAGWDRDRDEP
jgi:hypothetical protein